MKFHFAIFVLATLAISATSRNVHRAKPPAVDCDTLVMNDMMDCVDYLSAGSKTSKPPKSCCSGLAAVTDIDPKCICEGYDQAASMGIQLNMTRAKSLPRTCKVKISSLYTNCKTSLPPSLAPAQPPSSSAPKLPPGEEPPASPSPSIEPPSSPSTKPPSSDVPSKGGVTAPAPAPGGAYSISMPHLSLLGLLVASSSILLV